ncbi:MAG: hypothetical protein AAF391_13935, partial [Bacteroidota bacterium]
FELTISKPSVHITQIGDPSLCNNFLIPELKQTFLDHLTFTQNRAQADFMLICNARSTGERRTDLGQMYDFAADVQVKDAQTNEELCICSETGKGGASSVNAAARRAFPHIRTRILEALETCFEDFLK